MPEQLLVFTHQITHRIRYTLRLVFGQQMGINFKLTSDKAEFIAFEGPKINYSFDQISDEAFIAPSDLLFQSGVRDQNPEVFTWNQVPVFFPSSRRSVIPFDLFAAVFYMVSRYEEYLPVIRDKYDRFEAHSSLAYQNGFLQRPVVNIWIEEFKKVLLQRFPDLVFSKKEYQYVSTIDIDNAYAYLEKGFLRTTGSYLRSILKGDFKDVVQRTQTIFGKRLDPYETYNFQFELQKKYGFKSIYFFLVGDYDLFDTNVPVTSKKFRSLIQSIGDYSDVGIHPSFASSDSTDQLDMEVKRLSKVLHRDVIKSRQHFLRLRMPVTYRRLIELDIKEDYTMGFASELGFRAGICSPFYFYDLDAEMETNLLLYPFATMEATLKYYLKVQPEEALQRIMPIIDEIKAVNGMYISLWHNETISDWGVWKGWKPLYEEMIKYALAK